MSTLRTFVFTINNYTLEDFGDCEKLVAECNYVLTGFEKGEKGTPHIQGYAELNKPTRFNTIKKILPRAYIALRRGTQDQAIKYCKKDGNWVEFGEPKRQGERSDLLGVKQAALDGGMRNVTNQYETMAAFQIASKFLTYNEPARDFKPRVIWIWGPTGTGKSRKAREVCTEDTYTKNQGSKWWDGYDGHKSIIIDDFRDSWWPLTYMLALLDRYEFQVEVKGGYRQIRAETMVITSAFSPADCYGGCGESIQQLLRRIDVVEELKPAVADVAEVLGNIN